MRSHAPLALLLASLAFPPLQGHAADAAAPATTEAIAPTIIAVAAVNERIVDKVLANGTVQPVEEVLVQPQLEGLAIQTLSANVGDLVEAGQVLAKLADDQLILQRSQMNASRAKALAGIAQLNAQLAEVRSNASEALKARDRAATLAKSGAFSSVQADQAEAALTTANARLLSVEESIKVAQADVAVVDAQMEDIDLRLARTEVKAPVAGIVSARAARVGAIASASGNPMFTLIRDGALEVRADVAETDMLKIRQGQTVDVTVAGSPEPRLGTVRLIEPALDTSTRLGLVRIELPDPEGLRSGMFAEAAIIVADRSGVVVPVNSVNITAKGAMVLKLAEGRARNTPITTGIRNGSRVEILDGLKAGDLIVAKAGAFVRDGDRVNPAVETESGRAAVATE
ncbi:HlyD family secretion protein [Hoeflea marina]|uniref:HlyD family secretion protein n=1 Tax=Hoeflea marina TaxID=274592 RepID=A0A317PKA9_9HYPH|nr:efflux RND transporter periplasmic adaptor subunit [Hoeflea marina]PWW01385.1 HlyD family secretion protein [Hoeflea marina]